jgi:hypothetical protein
MLNTFTVETFEPHVGTTFLVRLSDASPIELTLIEASRLTNDNDTRRQRAPFRLIFRDPERRVVQQGTYDVEHAAFEPVRIFLVPIQADASGLYLEAVFT